MSQVYTARKPITLFGTRYLAGEPVPLDDVPPVLRRRLVEQRRVVPRGHAGTASPAAIREAVASDEDLVVVTEGSSERHPDARAGTCGWFGGKHKDGRPCGKHARGLCRFHRA